MTARRPALFWFLLGFIAIAGMALFLKATAPGIGLYSDSVSYVGLARQLRRHHSFTLPQMDGVIEPVMIFPPLYPALLAAAGWVQGEPVKGARPLHAIIFACNIFLMGSILRRATKQRSLSIPLMGAFLMMASLDLFQYQTIILSEGIFFAFSLFSFERLAAYLEDGKKSQLIMAAISASLAWLTRYAGLAWLAGGILALLLLGRGDRRRRFKDSILWAILTALPNVLWMIRNSRYSDGLMGRHFHVNRFFGKSQFYSLLDTLSTWFIQGTPRPSPRILWLPAGLFVAALWWFLHKRRAHRSLESLTPVLWPVVFLASYLAVLLTSAAFFQADLLIYNARVLMPAHLLVILAILSWAFQVISDRPRVRVPMTILAIGVCARFSWCAVEWAMKTASDAQGYASRAYRMSETVKYAAALPEQVKIFTNLQWPIAIFADRVSGSIPIIIQSRTQELDPEFSNEMHDLADELREGAILAYFNHGDDWVRLPSLSTIERYVPLECKARFSDGGIYAAGPIRNAK